MNEYFGNNDADKRVRRLRQKKGFRRTTKVLAMTSILGIGLGVGYFISKYDKREHAKELREVVEIVKRAPHDIIALKPGELYSNEGYTKVIGPEIQPLVDSFPRVNEKEIADVFKKNIMYEGLQNLPSRLTGTKGKVQVWSAPDIDKNGYIGRNPKLD